MTHLLLVAHGSRRQKSNDEIRLIAKKTGEATTRFKQVDCAFLELSEPSIPDGVRTCILNGATKVVVLPCFLSAGRHVVVDIPEEVALVQKEHPDIEIKIAPYIGASGDFISLLLNLAGTV